MFSSFLVKYTKKKQKKAFTTIINATNPINIIIIKIKLEIRVRK